MRKREPTFKVGQVLAAETGGGETYIRVMKRFLARNNTGVWYYDCGFAIGGAIYAERMLRPLTRREMGLSRRTKGKDDGK